jgi:hypothetical protein
MSGNIRKVDDVEEMSGAHKGTSPKKQKTEEEEGRGGGSGNGTGQTVHMQEEGDDEGDEDYSEGKSQRSSIVKGAVSQAVYISFNADKLEKLREILVNSGVPEESPAFLKADDLTQQ